MDNIPNLQIFSQTSFDSGSLSGLGAVVHQLTTPGDHRVTVFQADKPIQTVPLRVHAPVIMAAAAMAPATPAALHVNLGDFASTLGQLGTPQPPANLEIAAQGYVVFQAPPGTTGFAVQLDTPDIQNQPPSFDSRELHDGDIFAATLLRPGRYALTNAATGASGEVRVEYPVVSETPYSPPDALTVQVSDQGFQPSSIQLKPAQGLIFRIGNIRARIQLNLVEPDDGPASGAGGVKPPTPLSRWAKPGMPETKSP